MDLGIEFLVDFRQPKLYTAYFEIVKVAVFPLVSLTLSAVETVQTETYGNAW
jgi:hypothetical protein